MARFSSFDITVGDPTRNVRSNIITQNCSWIVPAGVTCATFEVWGAGGSGGARCCCDCYHQGGGGAAGGWSVLTIPVTPGDAYTIVVGQNALRTANGECHAQCCGDGGACTCITGTNITCLNAGCGMTGNNDCYTYCNCSSCCNGLAPSLTNGATSSAPSGRWSSARDSGSIHNWTATGGMTAGSCRRAGNYIGTYSDSQSWGGGYPTTAGGPAWRPGSFTQSNNCNTYYFNSRFQQGWFSHGGLGALAETCCNCAYAQTGQHGAVIIRY
jgi:hypothetical protein